MKEQSIIEMVRGKDGIYEPAGEVHEPVRHKEKKHRAERIYRNTKGRKPETFLDGFGLGFRLVGGMRRKLEDMINDALGDDEEE